MGTVPGIVGLAWSGFRPISGSISKISIRIRKLFGALLAQPSRGMLRKRRLSESTESGLIFVSLSFIGMVVEGAVAFALFYVMQ